MGNLNLIEIVQSLVLEEFIENGTLCITKMRL